MEGLSFYVKTYGCQMNVYDSDKIALLLMQRGMIEVNDASAADVVVLNTCHIREKAEHKVHTELGYLRAHKNARLAEGRRYIIAVGGCVAQASGSKIMDAAPFVDIVFGTQTYHLLPDMIEAALARPDRVGSRERAKAGLALPRLRDDAGPQLCEDDCAQSGYNGSGAYDNAYPHSCNNALSPSDTKKSKRLINIQLSDCNKFDHLPASTFPKGAAFLAIQEGCNKFCTYCVVPYTRGREISRDAPSILSEARLMAQHGVKEITLLGQNVNSYSWQDGSTRWTFASLVREVCAIEGIQRVFYTSSHPVDVTLDSIKIHAELPQLMPFWHLPVQSGSSRVLAEMNRRYSADEYKRTIDTIRHYNPHIAMCSDFIVGFPGETDADFEQTLELVRYVNYAQAFSFKYSARPHTVAAGMSNQIDEAVKSERLQVLQELLRRQQSEFNKRCIGQTVSALFQRYGHAENQVLGKSQFMQSVVVQTNTPEAYLNSICDVKVVGATLSCLECEFLT
ncbi:MAG: MiaB/RimO family radical SAM methylthiotransferase [Holosporales bacterium]|jgi:tRNA-2-methylthio-N6-dimethylallyladenosine synthase|nr:MiaB/RimO family radical SAM methylthiotransferase [Holosporales bacterium]